MLRVNPAAGQAFCRFMVGRLGMAGGAESGSGYLPPCPDSGGTLPVHVSATSPCWLD